MMVRFFVQIEYDGTNYHGFQKQPKTKKTIQYEVEQALSKVANHKVVTICSGRTCLLYTSPSPRDATLSRMPSSA